MTKKAYQLDDLTVLWAVYSTFSVFSDLSVKRQTNQSMLTFKVIEGERGIFLTVACNCSSLVCIVLFNDTWSQ